MPLNPLQQALKSTLNKLGNDADKVAINLRKLRIKGHVDSLSSCPIAAFCKKTFNGTVKPDVSIAGSKIVVSGISLSKSQVPPAIKKFIVNFDGGMYSDLAIVKKP